MSLTEHEIGWLEIIQGHRPETVRRSDFCLQLLMSFTRLHVRQTKKLRLESIALFKQADL